MQDPDPMVRLRAAQVAVILGIRVCNAEEYRNKAGTAEGNSPATSTDAWTPLAIPDNTLLTPMVP